MHPALNYASQIAYSSKEVLQFTFEQSVKYRDSPGIYIECGIAAGAQIIAMAAAAPNKVIYAFDSYDGIPLPSNRDNQMPGIRLLSREEQNSLPNPGEQVLESTGATRVSQIDVWNHIKASKVNYYNIFSIPGWFENTVPEWSKKIDDIAILRLDGDLYNSTYVCLKYLYPKVIKGGIVIVDDWALPGCQQAVKDYWKDEGIPIPYVNAIKDKDSTVIFWTK